jgi:hypothetical protein
MQIVKRMTGAAMLAASVAALGAQAPVTPALNVRMGLWEITSTLDIGGDMPSVDTSKMTPQQKAQMEAAMQAMKGAHTTTGQSCISKENFNAASLMDNDEKNCKQTITTNTASALEATVTCTGDRAMTATLHVDAVSQTAIKATFKSSNTEQGKTMSVNGSFTGKWLGADCGNKK